ncbi:LysE/ArgO family amino acid transporter [Massilia yuzhufengensis]|uniref:L-lysine exporter family protein LysE/ArgO n=1 Tax=Massilia yuzhufengensis TaxID=1164594 RepID=A0A1I1D940_9BURK|nr:LysE/ArgO family amino acid transporter [Massilia yuzhufengensis]SFB71461.1 L-lysine exporter family protein LysE/ArgO [Massilia yuzhufengensis]
MFSQQVFLQGLGLGASLIMAIGAQNAHVIRTGVRGQHMLATVLTCIVVDVALIALGVAGLGRLVEASPSLMAVTRYGGAAFLLWYGWRCWNSSLRGGASLEPAAGAQAQTLGRALATVLALSLLNPHVYLDTVVLLGAVGSSLAGDARPSFAAGAMTASVLWFTALGLGAQRFASVLGRPAVWRVIEALTGTLMFLLAFMLLRPA